MILSDRDIKKAVEEDRLVIQPYSPDAVQPVSVDLTLGSKIRVFNHTGIPHIDVKVPSPDLTRVEEIAEGTAFYLHPADFVLGVTEEWVEVPPELMGRLDGKSSLGRLGLLVHSTAGFIDPGFKGRIVLELSNISPLPISLYPGMPVAQISFYQLSSPAERPYGHKARTSKYQGQDEPTPSMYHLNFSPGRRTRGRGAHGQGNGAVQTALKTWLDRSEFQGDVAGFAAALRISARTVERWVDGRGRPGPKSWAKLYAVTGLSDYAVEKPELPLTEEK